VYQNKNCKRYKDAVVQPGAAGMGRGRKMEVGGETPKRRDKCRLSFVWRKESSEMRRAKNAKPKSKDDHRQ